MMRIHLDPATAILRGEGARIDRDEPREPVAAPIPETAAAPSETYYDLPAIKAAPWKWYIPAYFYVGGVSGAAATYAAAAALARDRRLARWLHRLALAGHAASAALLIADLGKPARFYNMLRVVRPTSPMNVGTWILSAAGASNALGVVRPGHAVAIAGALGGSMLSTYTGVLVGNTAVPVWQRTRNQLPLWFAAASAASLASVLELAGRERRAYSIGAKAADLVAAVAVERAAEAGRVDAPLHAGRSGWMWQASKWLGAASLVASVWPGRSRARTVVAGALGTASALLGRFAIVEAGKASAADPRATFEPQRACQDAPA